MSQRKLFSQGASAAPQKPRSPSGEGEVRIFPDESGRAFLDVHDGERHTYLRRLRVSEKAVEKLRSLLHRTEKDLLTTAERIATTQQLDLVSTKHLEVAHELLSARKPTRLERLQEAIGAALLGGTITAVATGVLADAATPWRIATFAAGILGALLFGFAFRRR